MLVQTLEPVGYAEGERIPVYLALAAEMRSSADAPPQLVPLGELRAQAAGQAVLRARVPNIASGAYVLVVYVQGSHPAYWPSGELRVLPPRPWTWPWLSQLVQELGGHLWGTIAVLTAVLVLVTLGIVTVAWMVRTVHTSSRRPAA